MLYITSHECYEICTKVSQQPVVIVSGLSQGRIQGILFGGVDVGKICGCVPGAWKEIYWTCPLHHHWYHWAVVYGIVV